MEIGKKIQELRKKKGMTQEGLAHEMGVSVAAVSKWENDNSLPDIVTLCALADFFDVSLDLLAGRNKEKINTLIVEPVKFMREQLKRILTDHNCTIVGEVETYEDLLEIIKNMDVKMQLMTYELGPDVEKGFDWLEQIRNQYPDLNIVVITNEKSQQSIDRAIALGVTGYITKPFQDDMLISFLNQRNR